MKVKIIRDTVAGGQPVVVGQVVDLPENEARFLISIQKAVAVDVKSAPAPQIETADLQVETESADVKAPKRNKK